MFRPSFLSRPYSHPKPKVSIRENIFLQLRSKKTADGSFAGFFARYAPSHLGSRFQLQGDRTKCLSSQAASSRRAMSKFLQVFAHQLSELEGWSETFG